MTKKIKIGDQYITVKDEDVLDDDGKPSPEKEPKKPEDGDGGDEGEGEGEGEGTGEEGEKAIRAAAKAAGKEIAKSFLANINPERTSAVGDEVAKILGKVFPQDAKLTKILGGKDVVKDASTLTKEEKIVGFYHALVTNNQFALKALSEGTDADGGYLFPNEFLTELVRALPEFNVMRNWVRIIPMKRNVMDITTLVSGPKVFWTAENASKTTTSAHFGADTLTARKLAAILYASDELIEDSDIFDVVQLIIQLFAEEIAREEEKVIWTGNGTTQPEGIDAAGTISTFSAGGTGDFDDIISLYYNLPRQYRQSGAFFMNDNTAKNVAKLKDTNGQYLWVNSVREGESDTIKGRPVVISNWVPDGKIYFGDMKRAYFLGDRKRITVKVSQETETAFTKDQTAIRVVERIGGALVLPAAARGVTGF